MYILLVHCSIIGIKTKCRIGEKTECEWKEKRNQWNIFFLFSSFNYIFIEPNHWEKRYSRSYHTEKRYTHTHHSIQSRRSCVRAGFRYFATLWSKEYAIWYSAFAFFFKLVKFRWLAGFQNSDFLSKNIIHLYWALISVCTQTFLFYINSN